MALVAPSGTVIEDGMVTWAVPGLSLRANETALGAAADKVTVQLAVPGVVSVWGLHVSVDNRTALKVAPAPLACSDSPEDDAAAVPVTPISIDEGAPADTLKPAVAITPLGIADVSNPHRIHSDPAALFVHEIDLPAAVAAEDAVKLNPLSVPLG